MRRGRNLAGGCLALLVGGALLGGCGGGDGKATAAPSATAGGASATADGGATPAGDESVSLPPGATPGLDDYDGDGAPDPTCGTQDFGAGLVLRIPCEIGNAHGPEDGTRLVKNSLYRLPGPDIDLTGISGANLAARDADGRKVFIMIFNSDALFGTGSDEIGSTDSLDNTIKVINTQCPGGVLQVRGHTDGTGAASSNQALSQRRAERVRTYLAGHGTKAASTSSVGLGSSQPLVEEKNPDGSASVPGRAFNRRVELVVRY